MNILVYDPVSSRLQQTVQQLGPGITATPVTRQQELWTHLSQHDLALLCEDVDFYQLAALLQQRPQLSVYILMEKKAVAEVRKWMSLPIRECLKYPLAADAADKLLYRMAASGPASAETYTAAAAETGYAPQTEAAPESSPEPVPVLPVEPAAHLSPRFTPSSASAPLPASIQTPAHAPAAVQPVSMQPHYVPQAPYAAQPPHQPAPQAPTYTPDYQEAAAPERPQPQMPWAGEERRPPMTEPQRAAAADPYEPSMPAPFDDPMPFRVKAPTRQEIVTITSSRGGAGKTTITYNLAALAAKNGISTVIIDSDPRGNMAAISNTECRHTADSWVGIDHETDSERTVMSLLARMSCGAFLLGSGNQDINGMSKDTITKVIKMLRRHFQLILIDCEPRFTPATVVSYRQANKILVVSPDDFTTYGRTIEKVRQLRSKDLDIEPEKVHLVLNQVGKEHDKREARILEEKTGSPILAKLTYTPEIKSLRKAGEAAALNPKLAFTKEAEKLLGQLIHIDAPRITPKGGGLLSRLFGKR